MKLGRPGEFVGETNKGNAGLWRPTSMCHKNIGGALVSMKTIIGVPRPVRVPPCLCIALIVRERIDLAKQGEGTNVNGVMRMIVVLC